MEKLIAHTRRLNRNQMECQTLREHSRNVAKLCAAACESIGLGKLGLLTGWLHDMGKSPQDVQDHILGKKKQKLNHCSAGMHWLWEHRRKQSFTDYVMAQMACLAIGCHHSGRCDYIASDGGEPWLNRMGSELAAVRYDESIQAFFSDCCEQRDMLNLIAQAAEEFSAFEERVRKRIQAEYDPETQNDAFWTTYRFQMGFIQRFLFGALVDADWTDTSCYMNQTCLAKPISLEERQKLWNRLSEQTESYLKKLSHKYAIDKLRQEISDQCFSAAQNCPSGIYRLYVPTGGGKTYSGLRFCIEMARRHNASHIFYFAPYKSITRQNADCIRQVLGSEFVLEHHSDVIFNEDDEDGRNRWISLSQRWQDVPVICTTTVQLLNTLFSGSRQSIRRLPAVAGSILLLDEIQAQPLQDTCLFNLAMNALAQVFRCTVVLCTATQPAWDKAVYPIEFSPKKDLVENVEHFFLQFKRVQIIPRLVPGGERIPSVADFAKDLLKENRSVLVILNTKRAANKLFDALKERVSDDVQLFCLTTYLCQKHRNDVMDKIKRYLQEKDGPPLICVSTQLIEAGVDLSFDCVVRSLAGLPSIIQAAGRCNRHGNDRCRNVYLIYCADEDLRYLPEIDTAAQATRRLLEQLPEEADLLSPQAIQSYYRVYYGDPEQLRNMLYRVVPKDGLETTMVDLLSNNQNGVQAKRERMGLVQIQGKDKFKWVMRQAFGTAEANFEAIQDENVSFLVPYGKEGEQMLARLLKADAEIPSFAELQPYTVSVSQGERKRLGDALMPVLDGAVFTLLPNYYDSESKGLCFEPQQLSELFF